MDRKQALQEALKKATGITNAYKNEDVKKYLLPYLSELAMVQPLNPADFKSEEEFMFALKSVNMRATVYKELLHFLERQEQTMDKIRKEIDTPEVTYTLE